MAKKTNKAAKASAEPKIVWGIVITRSSDGTSFLAHGGAGVFNSYNSKGAREFAAKLREHVTPSKMKVVRLTIGVV